jgi:hypothetical protein
MISARNASRAQDTCSPLARNLTGIPRVFLDDWQFGALSSNTASMLSIQRAEGWSGNAIPLFIFEMPSLATS